MSEADQFDLTLLAVGHGDAIFGRWRPASAKQFTFLVDGGPKATADRTTATIKEATPDGLDLMVLSHVDADHIDGLLEIAQEIDVGSYWGPCLAAFERYAWLFPQRVQAGLRKGRELEDLLRSRGTKLLCPVEGWIDRSPDRGLEIQVLNPPGKLYERLLLQDDGVDLFLEHPTPLGWLLDGQRDGPEQPTDVVRVQQFLGNTLGFDPKDLPSASARPLMTEAEVDEAKRHYVAASGEDVEFFGTSCLNDTSIVLWISVLLEGRHRRTLLLPGDLENWLYVLGRNARGLIVDVLKAPHHGGRMYVEREVAYDDVLQVIRPAATIVSANGLHKLPRTEFRDAVTRWSRALFCPCTRKREILTGASEPDHSSCNSLYLCGTEQRDVTLRFRSESIESNVPACARTPGGDSVPIVQIRQHIIDPSPALDRLVEGELRRHITWIKKELAKLHDARLAGRGNTPGDRPIAIDHLATLARQSGRHALANRYMRFVLSEGWKRHEFWSSQSFRPSDDDAAYVLPSDEDLIVVRTWLSSLLFIGFHVDDDPIGLDRSTLLAEADTQGLAQRISREFRFPAAMFRETIWPTVSRHLERWSSFSARSGGVVVFSQVATLDEINAELAKYSVPCGSGYFGSSDYGRGSTLQDLEGKPFFCCGIGAGHNRDQATNVLDDVLKVRKLEDNKCVLSLIGRFFQDA